MTDQPLTFEQYVEQWDALVAKIEAIKKELKPLTDAEMPMRRAIHASVQAALGDLWKEGMNTYVMPDGRKLKVDNPIERLIEVPMITSTREAYALLNDKSVAFDDLLRTKYELDKASFNKLSDNARRVIQGMLSTKPGTPTVKLA